MSFNCPHFIEEFKGFVSTLNIKSALEVGCLSGELKDTIGADGVDIKPSREDVTKADICSFKSRKKYDLVFSSGLLEHYSKEEAVAIIKAMAALTRKGGYVLNYVPNTSCLAYKNAKDRSNADWKDELDYTQETLEDLHTQAGLKIVKSGLAGQEWAKLFGPESSEPYLVWVLATKK